MEKKKDSRKTFLKVNSFILTIDMTLMTVIEDNRGEGRAGFHSFQRTKYFNDQKKGN